MTFSNIEIEFILFCIEQRFINGIAAPADDIQKELTIRASIKMKVEKALREANGGMIEEDSS